MDARLLETSERKFANRVEFLLEAAASLPGAANFLTAPSLELAYIGGLTFINGHEPTKLRQRICRIYASGPLVYEHAPREIRNDRELRMFPPRRLAELADGSLAWRSPETLASRPGYAGDVRGRTGAGSVTKAGSSIAVALLLISSGASATECQSSPAHDGKWWSYRNVDSKRCWYQGRPGRSKDLLHWAKKSPPPLLTRPDPGDSPTPTPPFPLLQPTETIDATPKVVSTVSIPMQKSEALQMTARPSSPPEPPPLPTKLTSPQPSKLSKWWMLLLIIPAIATGLAVVASQFQPARKERRQGVLFKNFRRRWTNWQARLTGHFDLLGDNITQWSRRWSRSVQIDPTSPSSERPSPRPWYRQHRNTPITPASCPNRPSSSLTTFDHKSLQVPRTHPSAPTPAA